MAVNVAEFMKFWDREEKAGRCNVGQRLIALRKLDIVWPMKNGSVLRFVDDGSDDKLSGANVGAVDGQRG